MTMADSVWLFKVCHSYRAVKKTIIKNFLFPLGKNLASICFTDYVSLTELYILLDQDGVCNGLPKYRHTLPLWQWTVRKDVLAGLAGGFLQAASSSGPNSTSGEQPISTWPKVSMPRIYACVAARSRFHVRWHHLDKQHYPAVYQD